MDRVRPGLGYNGNLSARPGAVLRRIIAALHPELLDVFEARLQPEVGCQLAVQVTGRVIDDSASGDAIEPHDVLLVGSAIEPDIVVGAAPRGRRARRQQVKL